MGADPQHQAVPLESVRACVEGYSHGGRIERHSHDMDQLALISQSAAIIETDTVYVVHPLLKALWLPAGIEHSVYSPRPFSLHALVFSTNSLGMGAEPQVLGLDTLARELVLFSVHGAASFAARRAACACLALLEQFLPAAKAESFSLPRPRASEPGSSPIISRAILTTDARWSSSPRKSAARACALRAICSSMRPA